MRGFYATPIGEHLSETPEGYLVARSIPIARTGYQMYKRSELGIPGPGDDPIRVWRDPAEVFSAATIFSFEGKPVVSPHPPMFVSPENIAAYQKGHVQHVREGEVLPDGDRALVGDLVITDATLISLVKAKALRELSAGYDCEYVQIEDEHSPELTFAQRQIIGNHVAVVASGRAGASVRILDAKEGTSVEIGALKTALSDLKDVLAFLGIRSPEQTPVLTVTTDADPGAVARNVEKNAEALEQAKARNQDCGGVDEIPPNKGEQMTEEEKKAMEAKKGKDEGGGAKEVKKEEAGATPPKEAADAGARDAATADALGRLADAMDRLNKRMDAAEAKEKEKEEKKDEPKVEDSELIPVPTLAKSDIPENPIPGAEKSVDRNTIIAGLLAMKPAIAATKNRDAAIAWNKAYMEAKGVKASDAVYGDMGNRTEVLKPEEVRLAEQRVSQVGINTADSTAADSASYADIAKQYHRRHAAEVKNEKARVN